MALRLSERTSSSRAFWTILRLVLSRVSLRALRIRLSSRLILVLPMKALYTDSEKLYTRVGNQELGRPSGCGTGPQIKTQSSTDVITAGRNIIRDVCRG